MQHQPVRAAVSGSAGFTKRRRGGPPRHCSWMLLDWGCRALTSRGMTGPQGYGLVDADTPKRAGLGRAIQISFLELLPQFPSEKDLL